MLNPRNVPEKELSEESCELEAAAVLPASCLRHLDSSNWKERIACLEAFEKAVEEMEANHMPCQALVRLLDKEPGWKETKLQVMQKKLRIVTLIAQKGPFSKTCAQFVLGNLVDKIGDVICGNDTKEALTAVAEACGLPWTAGKVTEAAFLQDSPRTHSETLNWLADAIKEFGFDGLEAKDFVGYIKLALAAAHPDVRASAFNLLGLMYLYVGAPLRVLFEDEKLSLLSQIDAEFEKVKGQKPPTPTRGRCKFCRNGGSEQRGGDAQHCPRKEAVDISKKITMELLSKMQDPSWKIRKDGLEEAARIISEAKAIQPSIGDLPGALQVCLQDANKGLVKQTLSVLQQLARGMGPGIKQHVRTLGLPLIAMLRDSKGSLRVAAFKTVEVWAEQTGLKDWLEADDDDPSAEGSKENNVGRQGLLGWLAEKLPSSTSASASADLLRCVPHLYLNLEDRREEMRKAAYEALPFFLSHLGLEKMSEVAGKLKPASRDQVLVVLEKAKVSPSEKSDKNFVRSPSKLPRSKPQPKTTSDASPLVVSSPSEILSSGDLNLDVKKTHSEGTVLKAKRIPSGKIQTKFSMKEDFSKLGPIYTVVPNAKEQRMKDEKALKVLRWNFSTPNSKHVEQLKAQMGSCMSNWLQEELFHSNFQHHIKALTVMNKHLENEKEGIISCLDLILKWLSLRLFDTNTWVLMKTLEYLKRLFSLLIGEKYQLTENEASSFLPYLLLKMGETKEAILKEVRAIVKQTILIYPASKTFYFLLEAAKGKNANQRVGCLKELGLLFKAYGPDVCQPNPSKAWKAIIALAGDSSNAVHSAALKVIVAARDVYGTEAFKAIGNISERHMGLLEESLKEAAARQIKQEKLNSQLSSLSIRPVVAEGSKQSHGANHHSGKAHLTPSQDGAGAGNSGRMPFCKDPKGRDVVIHCGASLDSQEERSITSNINMIICHVASGDVGTSIKALAQIQEILKQEDKAEAMAGHINQFLIATLRQLKFIHRLHVTAEEKAMGKDQVIELYRCVISNMVSLFQVDSLAQEASAGVLKDTMNSLIALSLDSPVEGLQEGQELNRLVNLLVTKVLEKSDQTRILSTLLALLHESLTASSNLLTFSEMVAKCLWNVTRLLPRSIGSINLDQVLLDLHLFMKALPKAKLKQYQSDFPHRALKTLLHTLCKLKGEEILDHLTLIENRGESELESHLWKLLRHSAQQAGQEANMEDPHQPMDGSDGNALAAIFKKINSKESARAGLEELYEYKKKYPDADLEPFLKKRSLLFRSYVKHGLAVIGSERESKAKTYLSPAKPV